MTTIVIPVHRHGGKFRTNKELGYTVRSIRKNFVGPFEIVICSRKLPAGFEDCIHLHDGGAGLKTALRRAADAYPHGFFWWYDDCVLLLPQKESQLKVTLASRRWSHAQTSWANKLAEIRERLVKEGHTPWDYSRPHGPYWFDKSMIAEAFADWPSMSGKFPFESWILSKRDWPRKHGNYRQYYGPFRTPPGPADTLLNYCDKGFTKELIAWLDAHFPDMPTPQIEVTESRKNALSFSLYGSESKYSAGMVANVELAKMIYPGWETVVHAESDHYAIPRLRSLGARVIEHPKEEGHHGMKWRFETCDDVDRYEFVCVRDADSRVNVREAAAVAEWLASGNSLHLMKDHQLHRKPVMGGMFGMRAGAFKMREAMKDWGSCGKYGNDEAFLAGVMWPVLRDDSISHDRRFPAHEEFSGFVGEQVTPSMDASKTRVVVLSPERYHKRRERFMVGIAEKGGFLNSLDIEWWKATPHDQMLAPPSFSRVQKISHWWAATCDHLRIMEETLLAGTERLFLFEDDAFLRPEFAEFFWRAEVAMPAQWKTLRLGWNDKGQPSRLIPGVLDRCASRSQGMIANYWCKAGLHRAYDHFWHRRNMSIDGAFEDLRKREPRDYYQPYRKLVFNDPKAKQQGRDA